MGNQFRHLTFDHVPDQSSHREDRGLDTYRTIRSSELSTVRTAEEGCKDVHAFSGALCRGGNAWLFKIMFAESALRKELVTQPETATTMWKQDPVL